MVRRLMKTFVGEDQSQRENIFHLRCLIQNEGRSVNVASQRLVDKLCIPTIHHPKPNKLQWFSEHGEMIVLIAIILGKYKDENFCDVVIMEATHVLLGRLYMVTHDGVTNKFSFVHKGNKVTLKSLTPKKILEDQLKMKQKKR
ncbi:hypothetical protein CR513_38982, partial [Mucuna pruriens]